MWTTVPFDSRTLPSHFKASWFRGGLAEGPRGLQKPAAQVTRASSDEHLR